MLSSPVEVARIPVVLSKEKVDARKPFRKGLYPKMAAEAAYASGAD